MRGKRRTGTGAVSRAAEGSVAREDMTLDDLAEAVRRALVGATPPEQSPPWVARLYQDRVVVGHGDGTYTQFAIAVKDDGTVTLGEGKKVEPQFVEVSGESAEVCIAEPADESGRYLIRVIREGFSKNVADGKPLYWSAEAIRSTPGMFNGARVSAFRFGEELSHPRKAGMQYESQKQFAVLNIVGLLEGDHVAEAADGKLERRAYLVLNDTAPAGLRELLDKKVVGFSINCGYRGRIARRDGRTVAEGYELLPTEGRMDVDVVSNPAAGGEVLRAAASILFPGEGAMKKCAKCGKEYGEAAKDGSCPHCTAAEGAKPATATAVLEDPAIVRARESATASVAAIGKDQATIAAEAARIRREGVARRVREIAAEAKLPERLHGYVLERFEGVEEAKDDDIKARVKFVRESFGPLDPSGRVRGAGLQVGTEPRDRMGLMIEGLVRGPDPAPWLDRALAHESVDRKGEFQKPYAERCREAGVRPVHSFRKVFRDFVGYDWLDLRQGDDPQLVAEAVDSSNFSGTWANVLKKYILANGQVPEFQSWRKVVRIVPLTDFRPHRFIRFGVHGDLPEVAEKANYPELQDPTDEFETVTAKKHGGVISWTWEAGVNDDVARLQALVESVGQAWPRTLHKKVWNLLTFAGAPTLVNVDNKLLFATDHPAGANLVSAAGGNAALDATTLATAIRNMREMKQLGVGQEKLNTLPRYLAAPLELHQTVFDLVKPLTYYPGGSTSDNAWIREFEIEPIIVPEFSDANDWLLLADPRTSPVVVAGFLGGREQADVYIQDNVSLGSMFQNDTQMYKSRGVAAVGAVDYRGVQFRRNTA